MEKQIEEMAVDLCMLDDCKHLTQEECDSTTCAHCMAEALYEKGYRKSTELAEEIFAEIETSLMIESFHGGGVYYAIRAEDYLHYKKKYTESEKDNAKR